MVHGLILFGVIVLNGVSCYAARLYYQKRLEARADGYPRLTDNGIPDFSAAMWLGLAVLTFFLSFFGQP